jgi:hypothetical protein
MKIRLKFFWRDFWVGFYLSDEEPTNHHKLVICLLPMLPIIVEWSDEN